MKRVLTLGLVALFCALGLAAQDSAAAADSGIVGMDELDALLGESAPADDSGSATMVGEAPGAAKPLEEYVKLHGDFNFKVGTGALWKSFLVDMDGDKLVNAGTENSSLSLNGSLSFSVRPTDDFRVYGKTKLGLPFSFTAADGENYQQFLDDLLAGKTSAEAAKAAKAGGLTRSVPNLSIWELFSDFNIADTVNFRVGKQMVKWGTSLFQFWSPADILAMGSIDYGNRGADREGPVAIKASLPFGLNLVEAYVVAPADGQIETIKDIKLAGRAQFVLAGWELGIGASYQRDEEPKAILTANGSIWDIAVFAEGLYYWKAPGLFLDSKPYEASWREVFATRTESYDHTIVSDRTGGFFEATIGANYSVPDIYMNLTAQYYFNGAGYGNAASLANDMVKYAVNGATAQFTGYDDDSLSAAELMQIGLGNTGMHYLAFSLSESFVKDSKLSVAAYWVGNLSDGSGMIAPSVSIKITDQISLGLNSMVNYGPVNSQYAGLSQAFKDYQSSSMLFGPAMEAVAGGFADAFDTYKFNLGISLSLGSGEF